MKRFALLAFVMCLALPAFARQRISVWCEAGNGTVTVGGLSAVAKFMQSFPSATVSIFDTGTTNLSTIYADNAGTAKANPFTCASDSFAFFYANNGRYDIKLSGTGITTPFTKADYLSFDPAQFTYIVNAMAFNATPTFDAGAASVFTMTLTGNVTSSTINNSVTGQTIFFSLCQDGTGGRTFSWPASFIRPPPVSTTASSCSDSQFIYDGTNWRHIGSGDSAGFAGDLTVSGITTVNGAINPVGGFSSNILPNANNTYDIGSSTFKWRDGWFSRNFSIGGTLNVTGLTTLSGGLAGTSLVAAANGNTVTLLNQQGPASAIVGTGADVNVYTYTLPANAVGTGKGIRVTFAFLHSTGTASVSYKFNLGATVLENNVYANQNASLLDYFQYTIFNNAGVQNAQNWLRLAHINISGTGVESPSFTQGTAAVDLTQSQALKWTFNVAATDQVTPKFWLVELIQ